MSRPEGQTRRATVSAGSLMVFQLLGLLLPLLTLPLLGRALGVELFGQIMLAQFVVFFGVVFIDSGFNTESQRRVAVATDEQSRLQALLDNLLARAFMACVVALVVLGAGALMPGLPMWMIGISLLHIAGTLVFPQWWFIARDEGIRMGLASTTGRLISAVLVLWLVRSPADAGIALLAASSATLFSGLMIWPKLLQAFRQHGRALDWQGYRVFMHSVRQVILSGFVSSGAQSVPTVVLGWLSGAHNVGLFSAADRLTRAAAHVAGVLGLSMLNVAARMHTDKSEHLQQTGRRVLLWTASACVCGVAVLMVLSKSIVVILYGVHFMGSVMVLQILAAWLGLYVFRSIWLTLQWKARGLQNQISLLQWQEGLTVIVLSVFGAWASGANGVAAGLILSELGLLLRLYFLQQKQTPTGVQS